MQESLVKSSVKDDLQGLRCPKCDYELTGLKQNCCPECGTEFDPHALKTTKAIRLGERHYFTYGIFISATLLLLNQLIVFGLYVFNVASRETLRGIQQVEPYLTVYGGIVVGCCGVGVAFEAVVLQKSHSLFVGAMTALICLIAIGFAAFNLFACS